MTPFYLAGLLIDPVFDRVRERPTIMALQKKHTRRSDQK
jgi:hypothetical protein